MNLLWRLHNGEGLEGLQPKAVVVLIGTNDLVYQPDVRCPYPRSQAIKSAGWLACLRFLCWLSWASQQFVCV